MERVHNKGIWQVNQNEVASSCGMHIKRFQILINRLVGSYALEQVGVGLISAYLQRDWFGFINFYSIEMDRSKAKNRKKVSKPDVNSRSEIASSIMQIEGKKERESVVERRH